MIDDDSQERKFICEICSVATQLIYMFVTTVILDGKCQIEGENVVYVCQVTRDDNAADVDLRGFPCPGAMGDSSGLLPSDFLVVPRQVIRCI